MQVEVSESRAEGYTRAEIMAAAAPLIELAIAEEVPA